MSPADSSTTKLILNSDQPWHLEIFDQREGIQYQDIENSITQDEQLLEKLVGGELGPTIRVWRNTQCLVATVRESRMPHFEQACHTLAKMGWPVVVRRTGGGCVPHGPGVINLSMAYPAPPNQCWQLEDSYQLLCNPLQLLLESYGLNATTGFVPDSFCDGRFNLQVDGQKLVGTAQRWRKGLGKGTKKQDFILAHACLLTDLNLVSATEAINTLYRLCDNSQQFKTETCITLRDCVKDNEEMDSTVFVEEATARLAEILTEEFLI